MRIRTQVWRDVEYIRVLVANIAIGLMMIFFINTISFLNLGAVFLSITNFLTFLFLLLVVKSYYKYQKVKLELKEINEKGK